MKLLLVDDDKGILGLLRMFVETIGHEPRLAYNGEEALGMLRAESVDVVVTDLHMPVMDGWTLAKSVKEAYPEVRVVGVAGKELSEDMTSSFDAFVGKPFHLDDLERAIVDKEGDVLG